MAASLFAVLIMPELWKNRNTGAMEIEGTTFYTLRQMYAARIMAFALADGFILGIFLQQFLFPGGLPCGKQWCSFLFPLILAAAFVLAHYTAEKQVQKYFLFFYV